jgi:outer membrane protein assembly factor BamB
MPQKAFQFGFALMCLAWLTGADWLQFRGRDTTGVAGDPGVPVTWNDNENVAWKADLPGRGLSGPIVVGDRVVLTASSGYRQDRLHVLCFDARSGKQLWERQFWATGRTMCHPKMCVATPTPASDGRRIFAFYSSNDVICLDLDGNLEWFRGLGHDYPNASNSLGMSSSPVVAGDTLVLQVENDSESFAIGLDAAEGTERWKIERPKLSNWTSPAVLRGKTPADDAVLLQSGKGLAAYDPARGTELWKFDQGSSTIPSTAVGEDLIFVPSGGVTALRPYAENKTPQIVWQQNRLAPGTPSPLVYQGQVFTVNNAGVVSCADAATGKLQWQLRLKGPFTATPIAAGGHLYFINESGSAQVVKPGPERGEIAGTNEFGETILATPAIAGGALFVRSDGHLWKIAPPQAEAK